MSRLQRFLNLHLQITFLINGEKCLFSASNTGPVYSVF